MLNKIIADSEASLIKKLAELIQQVSDQCIREKNTFLVGVSGGSLVKFLTIGLQEIQTDFSKWKIFFCDERVVPAESLDSTYGIYKRDLAPKLGLQDEQFIKIKEGATGIFQHQQFVTDLQPIYFLAEEAAIDYIQQMSAIFPSESLPRFDMLLLGMGPDGHTCSLFPNHPLLNENNVWIAPITNSPKPPPCRITMTLPVINNAKCCVFAMAGESKADMVKRILVDQEDLPATRVKPTNGQLFWLLDEEAIKYL